MIFHQGGVLHLRFHLDQEMGFHKNATNESPNPFGQPANTLPAPPQQQGAAVSAPYAPAQAEAAKNTAGATGMPQLPTTPEAQQRTPSTDFLDSKVGGLIKNVGFGMLINKLYGF